MNHPLPCGRRFSPGLGARTFPLIFGTLFLVLLNVSVARATTCDPTPCDDQDPCTVDSCDVTGCLHSPASCDDGNACTQDSCDVGVGCMNVPITCDDNNACTMDSCDAVTGCAYTPISCDDNDACTTDSCYGMVGCMHAPVFCNDEDPCTIDTCDSISGCASTPMNCDDQNACTADSCIGGTCESLPISCDDSNPCTINSCDAITGCSYTPLNCNDENACTADICGTGGCEHPPIVCDDSDPCTTDSCDAISGCAFAPITCDDQDPCTTDTCTADGCFHSPVVCDDSDPCTTDACDAISGCAFTPITCDDQNPCTTDTCTADGCFHSPVSCDDSDVCTDDVCDLQSGECFHTDICGGACCYSGQCYLVFSGQCEVGVYQGDGTSCDTIGICSVCGNGIVEAGEQCDDANTTNGDGCDGKCDVEPCWTCDSPVYAPTGVTAAPPQAGSLCTPDDGTKCDDGDPCTVADTCSSGACNGNEVLIPAACRWVIVGGANVQSRTRGQTQVDGDICGGRVRIGEFSTTNGDAVATLDTGVSMLISGHASISGDIITGGGSVRGKPRLTLLPGLATDVLAGGTTATQSGDPTCDYDTQGTDARVGTCADAQADIPSANTMLTSLPAGTNLADTLIPANGTLTLTATNPGGLNVFDFRTLVSATDGKITLDGAGDPATVFVLHVQKKLDLRLRTKLLLSNGTLPGNVILYSQAKCRFGLEMEGAGTVFCPNSRLQVQANSQWEGALVGGRGRVDLRDSSTLIHAPLQIGQ